jgi:hypothetical protein
MNKHFASDLIDKAAHQVYAILQVGGWPLAIAIGIVLLIITILVRVLKLIFRHPILIGIFGYMYYGKNK